MKRLGCILAGLMCVTSPLLAQDAVSDHVGTIGFGFFTSEAPVGIRYWASPSFGLDLGLGFHMDNELTINEDGSASTARTRPRLIDFAVEAGIVFPMTSEENMVVFFRPGLSFKTEGRIIPELPDTLTDEEIENSSVKQSKDADNFFSLNAMIGAEIFLGRLGFPNLSFEGGYGIELTTLSPAGDEDATTRISTRSRELSLVRNASLGFHIYLD